MLETILGILAGVSLGLYVWQFVLGMRFRFNPDVHARTFPPITILKPLKGCDSETESCLRSWLEQDYPAPVQVLFGVASESDQVVQVVRNRLKREAVICPKALGPNAKVSTLAQLEPLIEHDLIIISDADVAVPKDFLRRVAGFFESERPAVASCIYRLVGARNLAMRIEEFMVNSDFWTQVLQSLALRRMNFALGATMLITRSELAQIGGFSALASYLADDYQLGHRATGKVSLCPFVVECRSSPIKWTQVWAHQLRWARTVRVCQPTPFFFSILSISSLWLLIWAYASGAWGLAALALTIRGLGGAWLERKLTGKFHVDAIILAPIADVMRSILWALAFIGNRICWGGKRFRVSRGGKLLPLNATGG